MFESLSDRFEGIFTRLRGRGRLSESDVDEALREIRLALLEAAVNFQVAMRMDLVNHLPDAATSQSLGPSKGWARSVRP